jgi:protein tyrosine phosphatase
MSSEVECFSEREKDDLVIRELQYNNRKIIHLNYLGWPDHGVPENLDSFSNFILICEKFLKAHEGKIIVHCR